MMTLTMLEFEIEDVPRHERTGWPLREKRFVRENQEGRTAAEGANSLITHMMSSDFKDGIQIGIP
jgi:hypothetical protein